MDDEVLHRVEQVKEGLIKHVTSLIHNGKPDQASPPGQVRPNSIPVTPCSTPGQPKGFTSFVMSLPSTLNSNLALLSSHPCESDEKASRLREEVLKVDDMAQVSFCYVCFYPIMQRTVSSVRRTHNRDQCSFD